MDQVDDILSDYFASDGHVAGVKSVHGAFVAMAEMGTVGTCSPASPEDRWTKELQDRIDRHARVRRALRRIGPVHAVALWAALGPNLYPAETRRPLGQLAGVALLTTALERSRRRWWLSRLPVERGAFAKAFEAAAAARGVAVEAVPVARVDYPSPVRMLLRVCVRDELRADLAGILDEAKGALRAAREAFGLAYMRTGGLLEERQAWQEAEPPPVPEPAASPAPRPIKVPAHLRAELEAVTP